MRKSVHDLRDIARGKNGPKKCRECGSSDLSYRDGYTLGLKPVKSHKTAVCKKCGHRETYY